ncbi:rifin, partial [Plasmodium reichenowi]
LAEKIEKGCLKCGCALGGVAASVGLFGGLGTYGWKSAAIATAAKAEGDAAGVNTLIYKLKFELGISNLCDISLKNAITTETYFNEDLIADSIKVFYESLSQSELTSKGYIKFMHFKTMQGDQGTLELVKETKTFVREAVKEANMVTTKVTETQTATVQAGELEKITATSYSSYSAIGYSVLVILIIVLIMIIIYLVLRYRRKKKMNKKSQYTKLLNE